MHRYQTLLQLSLQTGTMVQKVDVSALATRRNCSFYLFEGMGINSHLCTKAGRKGLFSHTEPMCELIEGIVTIPRQPRRVRWCDPAVRLGMPVAGKGPRRRRVRRLGPLGPMLLGWVLRSPGRAFADRAGDRPPTVAIRRNECCGSTGQTP